MSSNYVLLNQLFSYAQLHLEHGPIESEGQDDSPRLRRPSFDAHGSSSAPSHATWDLGGQTSGFSSGPGGRAGLVSIVNLLSNEEALIPPSRAKTPQDLTTHRCICIRENDEHVTFWHLHKGKQTQSVRILPAMTTNDGGVARRWAESDLGVVLRSEWDVAESIANGALKRVLPAWQFDTAPILLLIPTRKNRSRKVQLLSSFLHSSFKP